MSIQQHVKKRKKKEMIAHLEVLSIKQNHAVEFTKRAVIQCRVRVHLYRDGSKNFFEWFIKKFEYIKRLYNV